MPEFEELWGEAEAIWDQRHDTPAFEGYVSADYHSVLQSLLALQGRVQTFLEWGSGLGVVTIMASQLGFEAYGIESEPELVTLAEELAEKYQSSAAFAAGSFIPDAYDWDPSAGVDVHRTEIDLPAAYDELEMDLEDFDLVYAYPWPEEHALFQDIMRRFARPDAMLLTYDGREGIQLRSPC